MIIKQKKIPWKLGRNATPISELEEEQEIDTPVQLQEAISEDDKESPLIPFVNKQPVNKRKTINLQT